MRRAAALSIAIAACGHGGRVTVGNVARGVGPLAFPEPCRVGPPGEGQAPWHWTMNVDCLAARTVDGGLVRLDWSGHMLRRINPDGSLRWQIDYAGPAGQVCGAPAGLAVAGDGSVALACGYSLLAFGPDGARRWQIWPGGDSSVGGPAVDERGVIYVVAGGALHAIGPDGTQVWAAGFPGRSASAIGVTADGRFALDTTEDVWFGDDGTVYHPDPDPQLVVIARDGTIVEQRRRAGDEGWPAWIPIVDEGGGRVPAR